MKRAIDVYKISMYRKSNVVDVFTFHNSVMSVPCLNFKDKKDLIYYFLTVVNASPILARGCHVNYGIVKHRTSFMTLGTLKPKACALD